MSTTDRLDDLIAVEIDGSLANVVAAPDLASRVEASFRRRRVRTTFALLVGCSALCIGIIGAALAAPGSNARSDHRSTIDLAGYTVTLPPGVHASSLQFRQTQPTAPTGPPSDSVLQQCKVMGPGAVMNYPASWGSPPYHQPASTEFSITSGTGGRGCISGQMTLPYGSGEGPTPDEIAPTGTQSAQIVPYPTVELDSGTPQIPSYAYYVQLPASGGGYQDLVIAAIGIPQGDLVSLVQQAVAQYEDGTSTSTRVG